MFRYSTTFHNQQNKCCFNKWANTSPEKKRKLKRPRWLASFSSVQYLTASSSQIKLFSCFKKTPKKMEFTCEMSCQCPEALRCPQTAVLIFFREHGLESLKICASTCASARDDPPSLIHRLPIAFKTRARVQKGATLQQRELYFETRNNVTTFKTADIFRNRSMSLCSNAKLHLQIWFQPATLHNAFRFTALSAAEDYI